MKFNYITYNNKDMTADDIYALAIKKGALNSILEEIQFNSIDLIYLNIIIFI